MTEQPSDNIPAVEADQPQAGTTESQAETVSPDEIKKLRREAQSLRTRLRQFEQVDEERKQATMSETEKLKADLAKLQAERDDARKDAKTSDIRSHAAKLGFNDPSDALHYVDLTLEVVDIEKQLVELVHDKPWLIKSSQPATIGPTNPGGTTRLTREAIAKMTPQEINRDWARVSAALESGK